MKVKSIVVALSMMLATAAWADTPNTDADAPAATSAPVAIEMPAADASPSKFQKIDENLDKLHTLVGQMKDATDPAERHKLMAEYMTTQHENMMLARDAMGMEPGMDGGRMHGRDCDRDGMRGMNEMDRRDCDRDDMRGMGKMHEDACDRHEMGDMHRRGREDHDMHGTHEMGGERDEAMMARMRSMEKRLDALQEMMKMMMNR